ncbi:hypothetical protein [Bartonella quintana]|nr:hypothetical protein [Bartonella quintana]
MELRLSWRGEVGSFVSVLVGTRIENVHSWQDILMGTLLTGMK